MERAPPVRQGNPDQPAERAAGGIRAASRSGVLPRSLRLRGSRRGFPHQGNGGEQEENAHRQVSVRVVVRDSSVESGLHPSPGGDPVTLRAFLPALFLFAAASAARAQIYYTAQPVVFHSVVHPGQVTAVLLDGSYYVHGPFIRRVLRPGKVFEVAPRVWAKPGFPRVVRYSTTVRPFWKRREGERLLPTVTHRVIVIKK